MSFADLHIHTFYSDSSQSPQEVVADALKAKLKAIAITDHDIIDGVLPAQEAARGHNLEVLAGIELSSEFEGRDIHILGYGIDIHQGPLYEKIKEFLASRVRRMKQMISQLANLGLTGIDYEQVAAMTKSQAVGRPHLAQALVDHGYVKDSKEAFAKYLAQGMPGYVPKHEQTPFEAIALIKQSKGVAVMAHPMLTQKDEIIPRLVAAGLQGMEVYYPNCSDNVICFYEKIARKHDLILTGGSDAHGKHKVYTHIGKAVVDYQQVERLKQYFG